MNPAPPTPSSPIPVQEVGLCPTLGVLLIREAVLPPPDLAPWVRRFAPTFLLNVGNGCNQNCIHCNLDKEGLFRTSPEQARSLASSAVALGFDSASLVGGEPTVWPHLFSTLGNYQKQQVRRVVMYTNGLMLSYPRYLPRLEEHGVDTVLCSLDDHEASVQRLLTPARRRPGTAGRGHR